ncbi:hypothetical protein BKA57DRAFT_72148 [Linnemannia elongata]|nr:hypothetical protein BKA57DRAFT_72148 [Linnemannia elongata]
MSVLPLPIMQLANRRHYSPYPFSFSLHPLPPESKSACRHVFLECEASFPPCRHELSVLLPSYPIVVMDSDRHPLGVFTVLFIYLPFCRCTIAGILLTGRGACLLLVLVNPLGCLFLSFSFPFSSSCTPAHPHNKCLPTPHHIHMFPSHPPTYHTPNSILRSFTPPLLR